MCHGPHSRLPGLTHEQKVLSHYPNLRTIRFDIKLEHESEDLPWDEVITELEQRTCARADEIFQHLPSLTALIIGADPYDSSRILARQFYIAVPSTDVDGVVKRRAQPVDQRRLVHCEPRSEVVQISTDMITEPGDLQPMRFGYELRFS